MSDFMQIIADALDLLKYEGAVQDTLAELRKKWGAQIPALLDERFDTVSVQYGKFSHEKGAAALGQELSAFGWALYDLDGEDIYHLVLIAEAEGDKFEAFCKQSGQYCRLIKQPGRKWGNRAREQAPDAIMPCEEYTLGDGYNYFFNSMAGDFAAGEWKPQDGAKWLNGCVVDLRRRPPQATRAKSLPNLCSLSYSPELEVYGAARSVGSEIGRVLVAKNPANLNWFEPSPLSYNGPPRSLRWIGNSLWVGDPYNATQIELTDRGTRKDVQNWKLPKDDWGGNYHCGIAADGLGRVYFSNQWYKGTIYRWENGRVAKHPFPLAGYDHLSEAAPVPGTGRLYMIHGVSGKGRIKECLLELDMDTGSCRIADLPGMGEDLKLRWFTRDWLLIEGNGEFLSNDFAQLINMTTREVLRIRPGMFGDEKMQHIGTLTDGTVVIVTRRDGVGPVFRYPTDFWGFLRAAGKPRKLEPWREYKERYPELPVFLPGKEPPPQADCGARSGKGLSLLRPQFDRLSQGEKRALMERIADRYSLEFLTLQTFARWGRRCTTGIFKRAGREFVFVPGDTVDLGWERFAVGLNQAGREELASIFKEIAYDGSTETFLQKDMTPVRRASIGPMLVARKPEEIGWEPVELDDPRLDPAWLKAFRDFAAGRNRLTLVGRARFERQREGWRAWISHPATYSRLRKQLRRQGFSLPTTEEWAYLCGGGCRTLFPWGDGMDDGMRLRHLEERGDDRPYDLEEPNFFGLSIAYDPYMREIVEADRLTTCGGDGGCGICGGMGPLLGYLPCSPHRKPEAREGEKLNNNYDFCRPIIRVALEDNQRKKGQKDMPTTEWMKKYEVIKSSLTCKIDLDAYFTEKSIGKTAVDTLDLGAVHFPTGRIFACDPLVELEDARPYLQTIPAGTYPVQICVVPSEKYGARYACVKVAVSDQKPVRYELGVAGNEDLSEELEDDAFFGFGVDAGMGCIADVKTQEVFKAYWAKRLEQDKDIDPYNDLFCDLLEENAQVNPKYQRTGGDWLNWTVPGTDCDLPIFASGWGDGAYPVYFGYDAQDKPCGVYIHFIDIAASYDA